MRTNNTKELKWFKDNDEGVQRAILKNLMFDAEHSIAYCRHGKVFYVIRIIQKSI